MGAYTGTIIEESLENKDVLKKVKITNTKIEKVTETHKTSWIKQWTLHKVEIPESKAKNIADEISKSLDSQHAWYADFKDDKHHYIIFRNKVFFINRKSKEQYNQAKQYGTSLGIPEYQVDFHPDVKEWKRPVSVKKPKIYEGQTMVAGVHKNLQGSYMENCIFCKIASGKFDSAKIWEDKNFLAILDINPNTHGMTLVIPKKHYDSYIFEMPDNIYKETMLAARKVAKLLEKSLKVQRVAMVMEGLGVNHAHIKLYPLHGLKEKFEETWAQEKKFFEKYEGYISTQLGPKIELDELKKIAEKLRK